MNFVSPETEECFESPYYGATVANFYNARLELIDKLLVTIVDNLSSTVHTRPIQVNDHLYLGYIYSLEYSELPATDKFIHTANEYDVHFLELRLTGILRSLTDRRVAVVLDPEDTGITLYVLILAKGEDVYKEHSLINGTFLMEGCFTDVLPQRFITVGRKRDLVKSLSGGAGTRSMEWLIMKQLLTESYSPETSLIFEDATPSWNRLNPIVGEDAGVIDTKDWRDKILTIKAPLSWFKMYLPCQVKNIFLREV